MAGAVVKMLENPELARKCGENARRKLMEEYNPEALKGEEIKIYEEVLDRKGRKDEP